MGEAERTAAQLVQDAEPALLQLPCALGKLWVSEGKHKGGHKGGESGI